MGNKTQRIAGDITLIHGDAREIIHHGFGLDCAIDTVVTDIPYGEASDEARGGGRERYRGQLREVGKGDENAKTIPDADIVPIFLLSLADSYYVFCSTEQAGLLRHDFQASGLSTRAGVWIRKNPSPMNGAYLWLNAVELFIFARHPKAYFADEYNCKLPVFHAPVVHHTKRLVKTQKPESVIREMILASTPPGGTVLDPMCGSGTTLKVARDLGRKAVGIELSKERFEIAEARLC